LHRCIAERCAVSDAGRSRVRRAAPGAAPAMTRRAR